MKAIAIEEFGDLNQLNLMDLPIPEPHANEVQIKIAYAGVNPVDWKISEGLLKSRMTNEFPIILGWDVSGTISKVGNEVTHLKVGEPVFANVRGDIIKNGTYAEYVCFDAKNVVRKPCRLSFAQAAAIPLTSLTAWQCLIEAAQLKAGETVLIHAGAGGVGGMAIQIAHHFKANVITTARTENHDYVKHLGANHAIDYTEVDTAEAVKEIAPQGVDVILDTVGPKNEELNFSLLKQGGRLVSIVAPPNSEHAQKLGFKAYYVFVKADGTQLKEIADLFESETFLPPEVEEFPLIKAKQALAQVKEGHNKGKVVLKVDISVKE